MQKNQFEQNIRFKFDILALLETRTSGSKGDNIIKQLGFPNYFKQEADGYSGGIWILWDNKVVDLEIISTHHQFVHTKVVHLLSMKIELITFVYGSPRRIKRRILWAELDIISQSIQGGPILVAQSGPPRPGDHTITFKFMAAWLTDQDFGRLVRNSWGNNICWNQARSKFDREAKEWHQNVFRRNFHQKNKIYARLRGLDSYRNGSFDHNLEILQKNLWKELQGILLSEEITWFQRSRFHWLKYGDKNTKFFHSSTVMRRRMNRILTLKDENGIWIDDPKVLVNMVVSYYQKLFKADLPDDGFFPIKGAFPKLSDIDNLRLGQIPSREEIRRTIFRMGKFKAPGPDGLHAIFFQSQWDIIGESVIQVVQECFQTPEKVNEINKTFICLIPKKDSPENMKEFRSISLCNVIYKIITKTISDRLRDLMPKLISPNQSSFIKGRQSADNIIVAQEVLHSMRSRKGSKGWMMIKVDLEKAYDRLSWNFIRETLRDLSLPSSLANLIGRCVSSAWFQLLWNGVATRDIIPERGIRQGDPLSPYLFVICMERLAQLIQVAVDVKAWKPVASLDQAQVINQVLKVFEEASGQKGVPMHHKRISKKSFSYVLDRVHARLTSWNQKSLSLAGRATLAKAVLEALPAYTMQSSAMPFGVCREVEKLTRSFLWGSKLNQRKTHLVNWTKVCQPKKDGGLGLRDQVKINKAFSMKLGFGLISKVEDLWVKVLKAKYKVNDAMIPNIPVSKNASNAWKGIQQVWGQVQMGARILLGDGRNIKFWEDSWLPGINRLLDEAQTEVPEAISKWRVADCVSNEGDWKWELLNQFLPVGITSVISGIPPPKDSDDRDKVIWSHSSSGTFSVSSTYSFLCSPQSSQDAVDWGLIWRWGAQRIKVFLWLLYSNKILSNAERVRRHMADNSSCPRCQFPVENRDYIFRSCGWTRDIWKHWIDSADSGQFFRLPFDSWMMMNLNSKGQSSDWQLKFGVICCTTSANDVLKGTGLELEPVREVRVSWRAPSQGWLKFNVDGSCRANGCDLACGGVLRDEHGNWIHGFSRKLGHGSVLMAELWGILVGLQWIWQKNMRNVVLEGDSLAASQLIAHGCVSSHPCFFLVNRIKEMMFSHWHVDILHTHREGNRVADWLAKLRVDNSWDTHWYSIPPDGCKDIVLEDCRGICTSQMLWKSDV
ncbi:uncharacterized protein LOC133296147 [Gastrolobium bilobum]|uniref:uncharacterized protein LOC133296147 n=1 Tax=Gastrolobium bilobum TaxID=150636 RepID=UPI002AB1B6D5|nr:uncharacterized protein LOC133296147 [Gastrolobium bilobum]